MLSVKFNEIGVDASSHSPDSFLVNIYKILSLLPFLVIKIVSPYIPIGEVTTSSILDSKGCIGSKSPFNEYIYVEDLSFIIIIPS